MNGMGDEKRMELQRARACNCFQIWGGVDDSIIWLSFAQQKAIAPCTIVFTNGLYLDQ
jgi:hypothetical protein